jgi:hypothetical protein
MYALGGNISLHPVEFFFILIFPYLVVLIMAYAGSRVVYGLGAAVTKARALRAKEWWDENRPASPAGTAEPVAV